MQSTLELFRHLYSNVPPLFLPEEREKMAHALEHLESDPDVTLDEIEDTMIVFGYTVWPWNQAFKEFYTVAEHGMGEHFLLPKLSAELVEKYEEYKSRGGTLHELYTGNPAHFFSSEERGVLAAALVEMVQELREYISRKVMTTEKNRYLKRVHEFGVLVDDIRSTVKQLHHLANREQDHPSLAREIKARAKAFEYGLCYLGPEIEYEAVTAAPEFFMGRKKELNRLKGMHVPLEIDFFAEETELPVQ